MAAIYGESATAPVAGVAAASKCISLIVANSEMLPSSLSLSLSFTATSRKRRYVIAIEFSCENSRERRRRRLGKLNSLARQLSAFTAATSMLGGKRNLSSRFRDAASIASDGFYLAFIHNDAHKRTLLDNFRYDSLAEIGDDSPREIRRRLRSSSFPCAFDSESCSEIAAKRESADAVDSHFTDASQTAIITSTREALSQDSQLQTISVTRRVSAAR